MLDMKWIDILVLGTIALQSYNFWLLSDKKLDKYYPLAVLVHIGYVIIGTVLAVNFSWSFAAFVLLDIWAVIMAIKGMINKRS